MLIRAKGEADSMRIKADALTRNAKLIEFEKIKSQVEIVRLMASKESSWDGKLPQTLLIGDSSKTLLPLSNS